MKINTKKINSKGFYLDVFFQVLGLILIFLAYFYIMHSFSFDYYSNYLGLYATTEMYMHNDVYGIAENSGSEHIIMYNSIKSLDLNKIDFSKISYFRVKTIDEDIIEKGSKNCNSNLLIIERFGFYDNKIAKFDFGFCK